MRQRYEFPDFTRQAPLFIPRTYTIVVTYKPNVPQQPQDKAQVGGKALFTGMPMMLIINGVIGGLRYVINRISSQQCYLVHDYKMMTDQIIKMQE